MMIHKLFQICFSCRVELIMLQLSGTGMGLSIQVQLDALQALPA